MNVVLFEAAEIGTPLARTDARAKHVLEVLRCEIGTAFDAGVVNGSHGKARIVAVSASAIEWEFAPTVEPAPLAPLSLLVGLPRPQTARDILRDATTLGVSALHFFATDKGDPNYAASTLWSSGEWRRHLVAGAAQAFTTRLPNLTWGRSLAEVIASLPAEGSRCILDNYESPLRCSEVSVRAPVVLAIGAERGWSAAERAFFREHGFAFAHLGERVLRTETACIVAVTLIKAKLGLV